MYNVCGILHWMCASMRQSLLLIRLVWARRGAEYWQNVEQNFSDRVRICQLAVSYLYYYHSFGGEHNQVKFVEIYLRK